MKAKFWIWTAASVLLILVIVAGVWIAQFSVQERNKIPSVAPTPTDELGLHAAAGKLVEADGTPLVLRGVNFPAAWYSDQIGALADIAELGANSVRIALSAGHRWNKTTAATVAEFVAAAKANHLITVLEVHDTTGHGDDSDATDLSQAVAYWRELFPVLQGEEDYVIINLGNEPTGNNPDAVSGYSADTAAAIQAMREIGYRHALIVDAPQWGQDWSEVMLQAAPQLFTADPLRNIVFSVHMYGAFNSPEKVVSYLDSFAATGLPLIVGEFAHDHSTGQVAIETIFKATATRDIGWFAWSWSGNNPEVAYLDLVSNFNPDELTYWGKLVAHSDFGIAATANPAKVFSPGGLASSTGSPSPHPSASAAPDGGTATPPEDATCTAHLNVTNSWDQGFQATVTVTAAAPITGWQTRIELPAGSNIENLWSGISPVTSGAVNISNEAWNGALGVAESTEFGFVAQGPAPQDGPLPCVATQ